jgi:hypothetical protein
MAGLTCDDIVLSNAGPEDWACEAIGRDYWVITGKNPTFVLLFLMAATFLAFRSAFPKAAVRTVTGDPIRVRSKPNAQADRPKCLGGSGDEPARAIQRTRIGNHGKEERWFVRLKAKGDVR